MVINGVHGIDQTTDFSVIPVYIHGPAQLLYFPLNYTAL